MLKKLTPLCAILAIDAFCTSVVPEAGVPYLLSTNGLEQVKTEELPQRDLGVFASVCEGYPQQFTNECLFSVFTALSKLGENTSGCVTINIDAKEEEMRKILDGITSFNASLHADIEAPLYLIWNGDKLGPERARDNSLLSAKSFHTKYIFLLDSDDTLHPDCLRIFYKKIDKHPNLYLLIGSPVVLGYLNDRPSDIVEYQEEKLHPSNFVLNQSSEDKCTRFSYYWTKANSVRPCTLLVKQVPLNSSSMGFGFLPAIIRYADWIPVRCEEFDGSMRMYYKQISEGVAAENPGNKGYATINSRNGSSFLYFYRLHSKSFSHSIDDYGLSILECVCALGRLLSQFSGNISSHYGILFASFIKEFCVNDDIIDYVCNQRSFDINKIKDDCRKLVEKIFTTPSELDVLNSFVYTFWNHVKYLKQGEIDKVKMWIESISKQIDVKKLSSLRDDVRNYRATLMYD